MVSNKLSTINGIELGDQLFYHELKPNNELMLPIKNRLHSKALGGMWTSTLNNEGSDWIKWCLLEGYDLKPNKRSWILRPSGGNLLLINSLDDFERLYKTFSYSINTFQMLNYERMAQEYDGIHLTKKGLINTYSKLWGWDCESTHWFRWCFNNLREK